MSDAPGLTAAQAKMREAGVSQAAIDVFSHYYGKLEAGATGLILEETIEPLTDPVHLDGVTVDDDAAKAALAKTAIVKLNGGLGTSMGMDRAKSLLPVRGKQTFLDVIVGQVQKGRATTGAPLPLVLMNSFRTRDDSLEALAEHPGLQVDGLPLDFVQNKEPKLLVDGLTPVEWPADPDLEWCPPGHGDIYTAILASGVLDALIDAGFRYASVSNSDNLGAVPNARIAGWFAASGAPYAAELCERTAADRKGGHLAVRKADGQLILRDTAQTAPDEMHFFTDEHHHPFFHTNNLWWDLEQLKAALTERGAVLGLPLIRNTKNVDPADKESPEVFQIETAMGAAIEVFEGATAIVVGRDRFLPVKTTNDLLVLRSDAYELQEDG
ncbi:MAG: UTP--glucose-1-phosphate uridylyltransferase, partial [Actinobacteria bacterium HGW-Actinobacteria-8]